MYNTKQQRFAFTVRADKIQNVIFSEVGISLPSIISNKRDQTITKHLAIWDTGATGSVISRSIATGLNLIPTGKAQCHGVYSTSHVNIYFIDLYIGRICITNLKVTEGNIHVKDGSGAHPCSILIGMDVIGAGDFAYTVDASNGKPCSTFSFRFPSLHRPIDFVKETIKFNKTLLQPPIDPAPRREYERSHHKKSRKERKRK